MNKKIDKIEIWAEEMEEYKLLDSGNKEKLEKIGGVRIRRAEPRAWWQKSLLEADWQNTEKELEKVVSIGIGEIKAKIKFKNTSKHIGIFPEQISEWNWIYNKLKDLNLSGNSKTKSFKNTEKTNYSENGNRNQINILNLFGYTGISSLICATSGANVTHVDASKQSIDWARENQKLSGLENAPIRWIVDDCLKFLYKEIKRGVKYDAIIMDPPSYGKGPKGEIWKIEEKLPDLLKACKEILSDSPLFIIFNMYSTELSPISAGNLLNQITKNLGGKTIIGELAVPQQNSNILLPMSIFALWQDL